MKKTLCILLVLAMALSFAGCNSSVYYTAGKLDTIGTYKGHSVTLDKNTIDHTVRRQYGNNVLSSDLDWIKVEFERIDGADETTADVTAADVTATADSTDTTLNAPTLDATAEATAEVTADVTAEATEAAETTKDEGVKAVPADSLTTEQRTVTMDDIIVMDFVGYVNGETFDGGTSRDYQYVMGSYTFIDGFDTGMEGKLIGEKFSLNLRFPDDYGSSNLAGKDVVFDVIISARAYAPTTDAGIEKYMGTNYGIKTEAELRQSVVDSLFLNDVLDQILNTYTLSSGGEEFIQGYIDHYQSQIQSLYDNYTSSGSTMISSFDDACRIYTLYYVLGSSYDWATFQQYIRTSWKTNLVLFNIADQEGLVATDDDIKDYAKAQIDSDTQGTLKTTYNITNAKEYVSYFGADYVQFIATLDNSSTKIYEIIKENNTYTVK